MKGSIRLAPLMMLCVVSPACSQTPSPTPVRITVPQGASRALPGGIYLGRIEGCAINPPLTFLARDVQESQKDGDYLLQPNAARTGATTMAALVGGHDDGQVTAYVIDTLRVSTKGTSSSTGEAWKIFGMVNSVSGPGVRLAAKKTDFSVCSLANSANANMDSYWIRSAAFGALLASFNSSSTVYPLDILGLKSNSYVRLRLRSVPSDADILLDGIRQPPRTDTILDVIAAVIPRIQIQKDGYEPCKLGQRNLTFEGGSTYVLNASCELIPRIGKKRR